MKSAAILVCLLLPAVAMAYKWDSCGTRYDRLVTKTLSFTATPGLEAGATATVHTTGTTMLHAPLLAGAWQVRIYELGFAHPIATSFGGLGQALHFTDPLNTTYEFTASFPLPTPKGPDHTFTASLISQDQQHAIYNCLEITFSYADMVAAAPVEEKKAVTVTDGPHFWSCGKPSDKVKVQKITITPAQPVAGKPLAISATGTSDETISGGKVSYTAGLDGIPLIHKTEALCPLLKKAKLDCPVPAGPIDISLGFNLPSFVPPGNYSAKGVATDSDGNELLCMQGYFVLA